MSATSQSAGTGSLYQFFAPGGVLAKTHPAYEFRRGQLQMAEAVQQALNDRRHLIVEAGTGTGKTLAYLLPILRSGKRVIVSTGTKNLQEQLYYKDIPFLSQHMPELKVCYMKGRNNYLCRKKLYDLADQPVLSGLDEIDQYDAIVEWDKTTQTGDRAELAVLPESSLLWPKLDARNDTCIGQKCQQWERCFITEMHRKAMESDVIIVNHHLFFADLAIKMAADGAPDAGILPEAAAVVFDEAHELEDVAGGYFGVSISTARFEEVVRDAEHMLDREKILSASLQQALESLRERAQFFFAQLPQGPGGRAESRFPFERRAEFLEENGDGYISLQRAITRVATELQAMANKPEELHNMVRRCEELRAHLGFILESKDRNTVFWIERRGGVARVSDPRGHGSQTRATQTRGTQFPRREHVYLQATPIDVSEILRHSLFEQYQTIVLTSATLAVGGGFAYLKQRLGLENARELIVPPHFDYEQQALLYIPPDLPDPREPQFAPRAADRIRRILEISRGRAFCLFTSYAQMRDLHDRLLGELEYPMLIQGSAPKGKLLEEFRSTANCVLFATASFWQGVDVQGEQLSCVIIDRLPFAVPNDPVVAARIHAINEGGGNAFADYQVPAAVITLKQGFGRLIRSLQDRGVLALLDNRILKKQYGKTFLSSLPPYKKTTQLSDVESFFGA